MPITNANASRFCLSRLEPLKRWIRSPAPPVATEPCSGNAWLPHNLQATCDLPTVFSDSVVLGAPQPKNPRPRRVRQPPAERPNPLTGPSAPLPHSRLKATLLRLLRSKSEALNDHGRQLHISTRSLGQAKRGSGRSLTTTTGGRLASLRCEIRIRSLRP